MSYTASKLLAIARAEIGYKEKETNASLDNKTANAGDNNWTKYARDLHAAGYYQANKNGYAWCDVFVDWCFLQLCGGDPVKAQELICQTGPYGAGCKFSAQYYKQAGRFHTDNPQPGDQIFFDNYAHTGIVEKIANGTVYTIEGNTSNQVKDRTYALGSSKIDGYGRPRFDAEETETPAPVTGHISNGCDEDNKAIYDALIAGGLTPAGAAGLMGNFMAESAMKSDNLQNTGNKKLDMTDAEYNSYVDNGTYTNFAKDGHGYGLAQWTYHTRKAALLAFAKQRAKSIGDSMMQVAFTLHELKSYSAVLKVLTTTSSVKEASDIVLTQYERPANMGDAVKEKRAAYGQEFYDKYAVKEKPAAPAIKKGDIVAIADNATYYNGKKVPDWVRAKKWIVKEDPVGNRAVIDKSTDGKNSICSPIDVKYLIADKPYYPDEGDVVNFTGKKHYTSANASNAKTCKPGKARVTSIYMLGKSKHPYHLVAVDGGGSTVYGWVDADTITKL